MKSFLDWNTIPTPPKCRFHDLITRNFFILLTELVLSPCIIILSINKKIKKKTLLSYKISGTYFQTSIHPLVPYYNTNPSLDSIIELNVFYWVKFYFIFFGRNIVLKNNKDILWSNIVFATMINIQTLLVVLFLTYTKNSYSEDSNVNCDIFMWWTSF